MTKTTPKLIIFAGANGSGKTTAAEYLLPRLKVREFVNADEIARGLSPLNPAGQVLAAGKLVLSRTDELIAKGGSFAIETTLSGNHLKNFIHNAHAAGYLVEMHYIFSADVRLNLSRIKFRVKQGGHHVPADDVRRRYWRSLRNFSVVYSDLCDNIYVYDFMSKKPVIIGQKLGREERFEVFGDKGLKFVNRLIDAIRRYTDQ